MNFGCPTCCGVGWVCENEFAPKRRRQNGLSVFFNRPRHLIELFAGSPEDLVKDENVRRLYLGESFEL